MLSSICFERYKKDLEFGQKKQSYVCKESLIEIVQEHIVIESYGIQSYGSYGIQIRPVIRLEVFWMQQIGTSMQNYTCHCTGLV
uniref:Ovule protein n=2 Tax=Loa loa TaxID=7209 RepID=A0A1I7VNZ8_LOALO